MDNLIANFISACSGFNWYGFFIGLALLAAFTVVYFIGTRRGYYNDFVFDMAIIGVPLAIVGARLFYVIFDITGGGGGWTFQRILGIGEGGLAGLSIFGGEIGAMCAGVIIHFWKRKKPEKDKITFFQLTDLLFSVMLLGQAIGRWGNFANQEAYGPKVDWHFFPLTVNIEGSGYHLATFFYEMVWNLIGFGLILWLFLGKRQSFDGFITACYGVWYGIGRAVIESLRQDALMWGSVRVSQVTAILWIVAGVAILLTYLYKARKQNMKLFILVEKSQLDESYYGYKESILSHPNDYKAKKVNKVLDEDVEDFYTGLYDSGTTVDDDFYSSDNTDSDGINNNTETNDKGIDKDIDNPAEKTSDTADNADTDSDDFYN